MDDQQLALSSSVMGLRLAHYIWRPGPILIPVSWGAPSSKSTNLTMPLAAYLSEAFGGPRLYTAGYGEETYKQRPHAGNGVHVALDEACLARFDQALRDVGVTGPPAVRISTYFRSATEAQPAWAANSSAVPNGLPFPLA